VNEIFDPDRVDPFYSLPADLRKEQIQADKATNYSVVRLELIEHVYNVMYRQRLRNPDQRTWAHRIVTHQDVQSIVERPNGKVDLKLKSARGVNDVEATTTEGFDLVIFGTGYMRNAHRQMLKDAEPLFDGDCTVDRKYRVQFKEGAVARDAGIWLQGCNEATHGVRTREPLPD
jgi:L-ornithine N5-oxygenase